MKRELLPIITDIRQLAEAREEPAVAECARRLESPGRTSRLIVVGRCEEIPPSVTDKLAASATDVIQAGFTSQGKAPWEFHASEQLMLVLEAGEFLDSETSEFVQEFIAPRQVDSYCLLFVGAERLMSLSDLDRFWQSVAPLLGASPDNAPDASAPKPNVFFAPSSAASSDLEEHLSRRLAEDDKGLQAWLAKPCAPDAVLDAHGALALVEQLARCDPSLRDKPESAAALPTRSAKESTVRCRRALLDLLERTSSSMLRELTASLDSFQQDLQQDIARFLQQHGKSVFSDTSEERLSSRATQFLQEVFSRWTEQSKAVVAKREEEFAHDAHEIADGVDWTAVCSIDAVKRLSESYPLAILEALQCPAIDLYEFEPQRAGSQSREHRSGLGRAVTGAAVAGTIGAAVTFPLGAIGMLVGGGVGAIGGAVASKTLGNNASISMAKSHARSLAAERIQQARDAAHQSIRERTKRARDGVEEVFDRLITAIDESACGTARQQPPPERDKACDQCASLLARIGNILDESPGNV